MHRLCSLSDWSDGHIQIILNYVFIFLCQNIGLFTADQNLNGRTSKYTRQNPNGNRYGYECPEERDYYPYWHPTDWIDIAVLTDTTSECSFYQSESFNIKPRGKNECMGGCAFTIIGERHSTVIFCLVYPR